MWQGSQHSLDSRKKIIEKIIQGPEKIIFVFVAESLEQFIVLKLSTTPTTITTVQQQQQQQQQVYLCHT